MGSKADLDAFVARSLQAYPQYAQSAAKGAPEDVTLLTEFPDEMRWGYPEVTLRAWLRERSEVTVALLSSGTGRDCRELRLRRQDGELIGILIMPSMTEENGRDLFRIEVEPELLYFWQGARVERLVGDEWVEGGGWGIGCGDTPKVLGVLTEVGDRVAVFGGQPLRLKAECPYSYYCECTTVNVTAELEYGGCMRLEAAPTCANPDAARELLNELPKEPWVPLSAEEAPRLFRSMEECREAQRVADTSTTTAGVGPEFGDEISHWCSSAPPLRPDPETRTPHFDWRLARGNTSCS